MEEGKVIADSAGDLTPGPAASLCARSASRWSLAVPRASPTGRGEMAVANFAAIRVLWRRELPILPESTNRLPFLPEFENRFCCSRAEPAGGI